jgi:CBS-domain-containing membrane protein
MNAIVKDVMTAQVVAVRPGASFKEMAALLRQFRVSAFPVVDDHEKVIGVVSEADLLAREVLTDGNDRMPGMISRMVHQEQEEAGGLTAGDLMTHPAVTVTPEDLVELAARLMYTLGVKRLPVVNAGGRLVGIISRADVLAVFDRPDEEIRREVTDNVILREFLEDPRQLVVTVQAGVVTLEGSLETAPLARDIVHKVRHVQGVVAVRNRLSYPDMSPIVTSPVF